MLGFATSFLVLRGSDLTRLMVTLGVSLVLREIANRFDKLTGGADGLQGISIAPLLGQFSFDIGGTRRIRLQPGGACRAVLCCAAHRLFPVRTVAAGGARAMLCALPRSASDVNWRLVSIYTVAAAYAGIAGALLTQSTQFCSLDVFSFDRSADLLVMLILGGTGYLYGGLIGAILFKLAQDWIAGITPQYWQFWIGLVLVVIVLVGSERIGRLDRRDTPPRDQEYRTCLFALETIGATVHFGGIYAANDVSLRVEKGARHALIGPNGAGKTTLINLLTGVLQPSAGKIFLEGADITDRSASSRRASA